MIIISNRRVTAIYSLLTKTMKCCCILISALILLAISPSSSIAASFDTQPVHWAYSAFFGTGWYEIEGNRTVFALNLPIRQTLRTASFTEENKRIIGFEIHYPVTIGFHNVDDLPGFIDPDNFGTISFTPGLELEIPITPRWYLRPVVHFGWGTELNNGDAAWIYYAGIKSRYVFPMLSDNLSLLNSLYYAGYNPDIGQSNDLFSLLIGLELRQPLNKVRLKNEALDLHWNFAYSYLVEELAFTPPISSSTTLGDQFIAGLAVSLRERPFKLWFMKFDRIGLEYRFSSNGNFHAISLNMRSLFTR